MFTINGIEWRIEFVRPYSRNLKRSDGSITVGMTDSNTRCVYLCDLLSGKFLRRVFCHEVCHCAMFSYDLHIPLEYEEFLCNFVADYGEEVLNIVDRTFQFLKKIS